MLPRILKTAPGRLRCHLACIALLVGWLSGCSAMYQDVHRYYRQMAINYKEAEEKAKLRSATLEGEANLMLKGGETHKYNRAQKEVAKLKDWEAHCAHQRERFEKAAAKMESPAEPGKTQAADSITPP